MMSNKSAAEKGEAFKSNMRTAVILSTACIFSGFCWQIFVNVSISLNVSFWPAFFFVGFADGFVFFVFLCVSELAFYTLFLTDIV